LTERDDPSLALLTKPPAPADELITEVTKMSDGTAE